MHVIASDHGGLSLKEAVKECLQKYAVNCRDLGTFSSDSVDYPDFGEKVALQVSGGLVEKGILICGTGIGMSIVANKFPGVRAALIHDEFTARMAIEHNDANIIVMGGRVLTPEKACRMVEVWLGARFSGGRHQNRLDKISMIEKKLFSL